MVSLKTYLKWKGKNSSLTMKEARLFALPYPLKSGWKEYCGGHTASEEKLSEIGYKPARFTTKPRKAKTAKPINLYTTDAWKRLRYSAFVKYGNNCACCGRGRQHNCVMHVDHIKPVSLYPQLAFSLDNLQILCEDCNMAKGNTDSIQWRP